MQNDPHCGAERAVSQCKTTRFPPRFAPFRAAACPFSEPSAFGTVFQVALPGRAFAGLASSAYVLPAMARRVAVSVFAPASKPHCVRRAAFSPEKSACGLPVSVFLAIFAAQTASRQRKRKARSGRRQAWRAAPERQPGSKTKRNLDLKSLFSKTEQPPKCSKHESERRLSSRPLGRGLLVCICA